ncbi:MAG: pyridoxal-phosphate dependent enzyme, partial [Gammaproteobacteria bacterium]|nr:pyridoxal-phosphate dependent enzyme [Gammaproteobacteria bacterium]
VSHRSINIAGRSQLVLVKRDDLSGIEYGGNKVRKLEYLLARARQQNARRIATFGAVGSNHAVATALYAGISGFECTCFLAHQSLKPGLGKALRFHQQQGTEILQLAPSRRERVALFRRYLQGRHVSVIPFGGSSWLGSVGFVNAGLELAAQIRAGESPCPARIYIALGTMGTAIGLALGLALAGINTEVQAIRVTDLQYANKKATQRLLAKCAALLHHYDPEIPADLASRANLVYRDEFVGSGYGKTTPATENAIAYAADHFDLALESTYTGKAMAALLGDLESSGSDNIMFWNTWNSRPLAVDETLRPDFDVMPRSFERYFD